jgi:hypothetical protein
LKSAKKCCVRAHASHTNDVRASIARKEVPAAPTSDKIDGAQPRGISRARDSMLGGSRQRDAAGATCSLPGGHQVVTGSRVLIGWCAVRDGGFDNRSATTLGGIDDERGLGVSRRSGT